MRFVAVFSAIMAFSAFSFAANQKCNYDRAVSNFEKRADLVSVMKGAKSITAAPDEEDPDFVIVAKESKPMKSGQFMGLSQVLKFGFDKCVLKFVVMQKIDPDTKKPVKDAFMHMREDGNFKAACVYDDYGKGNVWRENPMNGTIEPNPECVCYDEHSFERHFGKYGCLDDGQIEWMNEKNSDPCAGSLRCKLERQMRERGSEEKSGE